MQIIRLNIDSDSPYLGIVSVFLGQVSDYIILRISSSSNPLSDKKDSLEADLRPTRRDEVRAKPSTLTSLAAIGKFTSPMLNLRVDSWLVDGWVVD